MLKKKIALVLTTALSLSLVLSACGGQAAPTKISVEGSTSMQTMVQELADAYTAKNPSVNLEITADGSGAGIKAVAGGTAMLGMSSRGLKDEEKTQGVTDHQIAWDAVSVVVNPANGVTGLTTEQLAKIYTKEVTNWKDVGGADGAIVVVARDQASGTREAFDGLVGVKDKVKADQEAAKTGEVKTVVSQNPNAIGYLSMSYVDKTVKALDVDGVKATEENVQNNTYTYKRPFLLLTKGAATESVQKFLDFVYSADGATIITKEALPVAKK